MEYLTTTEAAERWGITPRRVQVLLINGNISTLICLDKDERSHVE